MADYLDGQQGAFNDEQMAAILSGDAHSTYGLVAIAGLAVLAFIVPESSHWILYLLIFGIAIGVMVDLYVNGYAH